MWTINRYPGTWLLPALLPVILLTVYPIGHALWTSLHEVMILFPGEPFVGLKNYQRVITGEYFGVALRNSLVFTLVAAPLVVLFGTLIALFLQKRFAGSQVVRSVVLLPWVLPGAISAVLWVWVFHPSFGFLNSLMLDLGLIGSPIGWLTNPRTALGAVLVAHVWTQIPFAVVLMMAALSTINGETLEAAAIDCRSPWKRFRHVVFPEIKAMIVVLLVQRAHRLHQLRHRLRDDGRRPGHGDDAAQLPDLARELLDVRFRRRLGGRLHRRADQRAADRRHHQGAAFRPFRGE